MGETTDSAATEGDWTRTTDGRDGYNYDQFSLAASDAENVKRGVEAGERAADATLATLDGESVRLSELWSERPAVVEFGSITCPVFTGKVDVMNALARTYAGEVDFYVVYAREAHPGQRYPAHRSFEEKVANASEARREEGVDRTVLVDDLDGTMHRAYDALPNSAYVVGTDGVVAHRADWTDPAAIDRTLAALLEADGRGAAVDAASLEENFEPPNGEALAELVRVLRRAGPGSLRDFLTAMPRMLLYRFRNRR